MHQTNGTKGARKGGIAIWAIVGICCVLPLVWMVIQVAMHPGAWGELTLDQFRVGLMWRTLFYNLSAAVIAVVMAIPAAMVLGRGRGWVVKVLWVVLPVSLLFPSISYAYGWAQFLRLLGIDPVPQEKLDVLRCVWTLATWLWGVPAGVIGLGLRGMDANVQQQALLDGVLWRTTFRQLSGVILASGAIVGVLAMQEFSVYERTGISVVATEVRAVFESGQSGQWGLVGGPSSPSPQPSPVRLSSPKSGVPGEGEGRSDQATRAAGAIVISLPLLLVVGSLLMVVVWGMRKTSAIDGIEVEGWPIALDAPAWAGVASMVTVLVTVAVPIVAMVLSMKRPMDLGRMWGAFSPQMEGSIFVATITGIIAVSAALWASVRRNRGAVGAAVAAFLVGGQLLAIGLIRMYNRKSLGWVYNSAGIVVMAYLARFVWIALVAGRATWSPAWKQLRELAAMDGASAGETARGVVWPLAWPICVAAGVLVMILSLGEVPATVLLQPQRPRMIVPMLVTWVHVLRSDDMIEGSLMVMGLVVVLGVVAVGLIAIGRRAILRPRAGMLLLVICYSLLVGGCDGGKEPEAIWCETGTGPAQVVYPRGITYSPKADTFFVVDRVARIQQIDHSGKCVTEWRMPEWVTGKPVGISVGPDGNVYVPDTHYHRVIVFTPDGKEIRRWGSIGKEHGQFIFPTDIAFDSKGNIFVSEYGDNDRVQVFSSDGKFLYQFGKFGTGDGEFSRPQSMVIDHDTVYITDACNHRLVVFKTDGTFVRAMGTVGSELGQFRFPYGLDMDSKGRLVVCEFGNNRVQLIDKETGKGLATWGTGGREAGEFAYPWAVAVDRKGKVVAVDSGNNRLQVFRF